MRPFCLLMIFLHFTLLYLIIYLKINLLILLKEPAIEKAYLVCNDIIALFIWENLKNIMHGLVKMYVMR